MEEIMNVRDVLPSYMPIARIRLWPVWIRRLRCILLFLGESPEQPRRMTVETM